MIFKVRPLIIEQVRLENGKIHKEKTPLSEYSNEELLNEIRKRIE